MYFSNEVKQKVKKLMKRCSISQSLEKGKPKPQCDATPCSMTITEEIITSPGKYVEKLELLHNVGGDENNAVTLENSLAISETVKHRVST